MNPVVPRHPVTSFCEQVFINPLNNARDAIEEKLEQTGWKDFEKKIRLKIFAGNGRVKIEIEDSGLAYLRR